MSASWSRREGELQLAATRRGDVEHVEDGEPGPAVGLGRRRQVHLDPSGRPVGRHEAGLERDTGSTGTELALVEPGRASPSATARPASCTDAAAGELFRLRPTISPSRSLAWRSGRRSRRAPCRRSRTRTRSATGARSRSLRQTLPLGLGVNDPHDALRPEPGDLQGSPLSAPLSSGAPPRLAALRPRRCRPRAGRPRGSPCSASSGHTSSTSSAHGVSRTVDVPRRPAG